MTSQTYPDLKTALKIWQEGIDFRLSQPYAWPTHKEYIFHTTGIGEAAQKIASKTPYLNSEKAYVLGLLHDYGKKYDERQTGKFHGQTGYEELLKLGYDECARICLTHSFPNKDFNDKYYASYKPERLEWAHQKLGDIEEYDDYDKLIQLCDMFFEGMSKVRFEERFAGIRKRYGLSKEQTAEQENYAKKNKDYFDELCKEDVYSLLNI